MAFSKSASSAMVLALVSSCGGSTGQLEPRYVAVHNAMSALGHAQSGPVSEGELDEGEEVRSTLSLQESECVTFISLGDTSLRNIDLSIVGDGAQELARDQTIDRHTALHFCAPRTGEYQLVVRAAEGHGDYLITSYGGTGSSGGMTRAVAGGSCTTAGELVVGQAVSGTTVGGSSELTPSCGGEGAAPERVYRLVMRERGLVTVSVESDFDAMLYLLSTCSSNGQSLACNDDHGDTAHSQVTATLEPGTYFVVVDGYGTAEGAFQLHATSAQVQDPAQFCAAAPTIAPGQTERGDTSTTANHLQATCAGGTESPDAVYQFNVPTRSRYRALANFTFDGALYIRRSCTDAASEVACNDDFNGTAQSLLSGVLEPGTYFLVVDGFGGNNAGQYDVTLDLGTPPVAGRNTCDTRPAVNVSGATEFDTMSAGDQLRASCVAAPGGSESVHALDVRVRSRVQIRATEVGFEGAIAVLRGCAPSAPEQACAPIQAGEGNLDVVLEPGNYTVLIDGAGPDAFGRGHFTIETSDVAQLARTCSSAPILRPGQAVRGSTATGTNQFTASCIGRGNSNDVVYRIQVARRSDVTVTLSTPNHDGAISLRRDCLAAEELACNDDADGNTRTSRVSATLDRGTYYVIVDGFAEAAHGDFELSMTTGVPGSAPAPAPTPIVGPGGIRPVP